MLVKRLYMDNPLRNYTYIVACEKTSECLVIDPFDAAPCLEVIEQHGWQLEAILNTHAHWDHIQGNAALVEATQAPVLAHHDADIPECVHGLSVGDHLQVGETVAFHVLDTPGHTQSHVCFLSESQPPVLFCGDTLFNAGAGNCHNGGDPQLLYRTFSDQLVSLPDETHLYPGHDYMENNLRFTLDREPENEKARQLLDQVSEQTPSTRDVFTLAMEKEVNVFFRLDSEHVRARLHDLPETNVTEEAVFIALRRLRDQW